ncbi:lysophospholipid acyltransferase family protein [Desulfurispora thermophila]|uniref:lysophospholipid acyltransferase family protein n=1 Tax=Desulfurispora thermophila TaxID=265470 RepID=UPI00035F34B1|nr:1-acylglycerol-3-phosphate O-acyltransferase [Desulfurispora thermophila]
MFYSLARFICQLYLLFFRRWKIKGAENIPRQGGLLVICNHISYLDPVAVGCALPRRIYFMAKSELFEIPILKQIITALGAFPLHRGSGDLNAVKTALRYLQAGKTVGIFPEGTRSKTEGLLDPHQGAAMLAIRTGVPVLPIAVSGTRGFFSRVRVNIGQPVIPPARDRTGKDTYYEFSRLLMQKIDALHKELREY